MKPFLLTSFVAAAALAVSVAAQAPAPAKPAAVSRAPETPAERAARVHREAIVLDTHIDTTSYISRPGWDFRERHQAGRGENGNAVDLPRMREGGFNAAFFSIFMPGTITGPEAVKRSFVLIDNVRRLVEQNPKDLQLAVTAAEVRAAHRAGKIAVLMGMEGGHMIDDNLSILRDYQRLGVRYLTLTHSINTNWADSSGDTPAHNGLTPFGKDVVRELNRLGMMVDISHTADKTFWDALELSRAPIVASHSSCRAISGHPRNMTDEMIKALAAKGGVMQINYLDEYLDNDVYEAAKARAPQLNALRTELEQKYPGPENAAKRRQELMAAQAKMPPLPVASWTKIIDHIDHAVKLVGATHVGLGSDFDGANMPQGMEDCTMLPKITAALLDKGYSEQDVKNILGENLLRLLEKVDTVGREIRAGRIAPAS